MTAAETTADLRARVDRRFRKHSGAMGIPEHVVLHEVPVDSIETNRDTIRHGLTNAGRPTDHLDAPTVPDTATHGDYAVKAAAQVDRYLDAAAMRRRIDVLAVGQWRAVAGDLIGFEVKATRSDLQTELRDPLKAEAGARYCHRWWLVLPSLDLIAGLTLPDRWGVLVRRGPGLGIARQAATVTPDPLPPRLLASIAASATNQGLDNDARGLDAVSLHVRRRWPGYSVTLDT